MAGILLSRALIVVAACALPLAATAASAQTGFSVTVRATATYGNGPDWGYTFSPSLPAGWSWAGNASCATVVLNGVERAISDVYQKDLVPGTYQLLDCAISAGNPLMVRSPDGGTFPVVGASGQSYRVWKVHTEVGAYAERNGSDIVFTSIVLDRTKESTSVVGARVTIAYVAANGWWTYNACSALTTREPGSRFAIAECSVNADTILSGTGEWQAIFEGTDSYGGHSYSGRVEGGRTSTAQAATNLQQSIDANTVTIVKTEIPPNCAPKDETSVSLFTVSMSIMNCDQIKALQIATKVGMTVAMAATGIGVKAFAAYKAVVAANSVKAWHLAQTAIVAVPK